MIPIKQIMPKNEIAIIDGFLVIRENFLDSQKNNSNKIKNKVDTDPTLAG
jgi:hypothetical protein